MNPPILVFAGSTRANSLNRRLVELAAVAIGRAGGKPTVLSLADYELPIYQADLERTEGLPAKAGALKAIFKQHAGFFIASPEYNASVAPLLKNAIDWVSRATASEHGKVPYQHKVAALASISPAPLAGVRGLVHLRQILTALGTWVVPDQLCIGGGAAAFTEAGALRDPQQQEALDKLVSSLVGAAGRMGLLPSGSSAGAAG